MGVCATYKTSAVNGSKKCNSISSNSIFLIYNKLCISEQVKAMNQAKCVLHQFKMAFTLVTLCNKQTMVHKARDITRQVDKI